MSHFALKKLDFGLGQVEQREDAVVEFGFGLCEFASVAMDLGAFLCDVRLPFVGRARAEV